MIEKISSKQFIDVFEFIKKDKYYDFYITKNKERKFLNDITFLKKILNRQEVYGLYDNDLKGLLMINKEKGFRTYVKILGETEYFLIQLFRYLNINFGEEELYLKIKKENPICEIAQKMYFIFVANRGSEVLLFRQAMRRNK